MSQLIHINSDLNSVKCTLTNGLSPKSVGSQSTLYCEHDWLYSSLFAYRNNYCLCLVVTSINDYEQMFASEWCHGLSSVAKLVILVACCTS